ncbi:MAG: tetratricopeptide repeat protein [Calditrichaeota bacterium]|nr:MAG: tetratricopeptide repeat protein [Calditrichota bacterium]
MPDKQKKKNLPAGTADSQWALFLEWLNQARDSHKDLDTLLEELRELNVALLDEKEQKLRVSYFERTVEQLLQQCFPNLPDADRIKVQLWKGNAYETFGEWDKALAAYQQVLASGGSGEFAALKSEALVWIGHIQLMQSHARDALRAYEQSLELAKQCGDKKAEANAYHGLAYYHFEHGELGKAIAHWEKALEIAEKLNQTELIAKFTTNLGVAANVQGKWEKALAYYGESLSQVERINDWRGLAETYHNMAMTYADANRWAEAGAYYEKSYRLAKKAGDVRLQALVKLNRVELHMAIGDSRVAEALCNQALRAFVQLDDHLGEADAYKFLGMVNTQKHEWNVAKAHFEKSIQLTRRFKNPLCEAEAHFEFGRMWRKKGRPKSAVKQFEKALALFKQVSAEKEIARVKQEIASLG